MWPVGGPVFARKEQADGEIDSGPHVERDRVADEHLAGVERRRRLAAERQHAIGARDDRGAVGTRVAMCAAPIVTAGAPNACDSRIRTCEPPMLVRTIIRIVWL